MNILRNLDKEIDKHLERNNSDSTANRMKEILVGKDKNLKGGYLGLDDRLSLLTQINKLVACHKNANIDFNRQLGPFVGTYEILNYEEQIRKGNLERVVKPDLVTMQIPWYMVTTLLTKIYAKYHKNPFYKLNNKGEGSPFENIVKRRKQGVYVSASNNPNYQWTEGWEFNVEPFGHQNIRSFQKARVKIKRKYLKEVLDAKDKERRRIAKEEAEKKELEKQKKRKEILKQKYSNTYETLDHRDNECYAICEKKKIFTKNKNKSNCLYIGKTSNFAARRKSYRDFRKPNNEIVNKLVKKFPKKDRDGIIMKLINNIRVKRFKFKCLQDEKYLDHVEGYLIQRINPLINTSKSNGRRTLYKNRSYTKFVLNEEEKQ